MASSMSRWVNKVAVVTGAGSGIGAAIARKLAKEGVRVVGLDKSETFEDVAKKLTDKEENFYAVKADVCKEDTILNAFKWTTENIGPVNILVNCAGIQRNASLIDGQTQFWKEVFDTNTLGLCISTREALKIMRENRIDGHIVHINSILGHKVLEVGNSSMYPASKYAVTALTETLRVELKSLKSNIKITSVSPGGVDTAIFSEDFRQTELFKKIVGNCILKPEDIANAVVYVLSTPPHVQVEELTITHVNRQH